MPDPSTLGSRPDNAISRVLRSLYTNSPGQSRASNPAGSMAFRDLYRPVEPRMMARDREPSMDLQLT